MDARERLAVTQRQLVAALVAGQAVPAGFDARRVRAVGRVLSRKRCAEVAGAWPGLVRGYGPDWPGVFVRWAAGRPPRGGLRDGLAFARDHRDALPTLAAVELAVYEARWADHAGREPRRRRRFPVLRRFSGGVVLGVFGRVAVWRR